MQYLNDLLVLRQHLRNAVAGLRAMVLDDPAALSEPQPLLARSLRESACCAGQIDRQEKDDDQEAVWGQFKARYDHFREAADTSRTLLERWKSDGSPETFQAAASFMGDTLFAAHASVMGLLNHLISMVAFDWPAELAPAPLPQALKQAVNRRFVGESGAGPVRS